ncbi:MAG: ABC transporter family substrate-binding protein, partial [Gemmatimonadetes bacterium]|nr:ABC transporter family substrate-binding protein [Gemmatimonadota bacterium]
QFESTSQDEAAEIANQTVELLVPDAYVLPMFDVPVYMFVTDDYINIRDNGAGSLRALYENHTWGMVAQ